MTNKYLKKKVSPYYLSQKDSSFTSYKGGLFQIQTFRFIFTSSYIDRQPSATNVNEVSDKPRKIILAVSAFKYISSKGESDWRPAVKPFDKLAGIWVREILLDETKRLEGAGKRPSCALKKVRDNANTRYLFDE